MLLWLLVLALPVQGYAAVMQMSCAPTMHQATTPEVIVAADAMHADHAHHHGMQHEASAEQAPAAKVAKAGEPSHGKQTHMKCSVCAAGCIGMTALPSTPDWSFAPLSSSPVVSSIVADFLGHIPDGIKRPPKTSLV